MTDRHTTIRASQLRNLSITAEDLSPNSITGDKLVDGTISGAKLVIGTIAETSLDISNDPVDGYYLKYTTASGMEWAEGGGGVSDHGSLTGLEDDDHSQYVKSDGTRSFTGTVSGVTPTADAHLATKAYADSLSSLPTGSIMGWMMDTPPDGWLECDGSAVSKTVYASLYAVISGTYGEAGDNFNLPDLRGEFLRGWDHTTGNDPDAASRTDRGDGTTGDNVGTKQADEFESHTHEVTAGGSGGSSGIYACNQAYTIPTQATGGNETRPRNVAVMWCIKYTTAALGLTTDHGDLTGLSDDDHTQYFLVDGTREGTGNFTTSGSVTIYNNKRYRAKDSGGTIRRVAYLSDTDQMIYGDVNINQNYYRCLDDHVFQTYTGGVFTRMHISPVVGIALYDDVTISAGNNLTISSGTVTIGSAGTLEAGQDSPTGSGVLGYNGYFYATRVYNAVYNDIADFQELADELIYGKCYYDTLEGARICNTRCQKSVIGIASDTYGFGVGKQEGSAPFAIAGWVLANVDQEYEPGDVLTNDENGNLTLMTEEEKCKFPERIVAIYKKKEKEKFCGPDNEIEVKDRHWVKVK